MTFEETFSQIGKALDNLWNTIIELFKSVPDEKLVAWLMSRGYSEEQALKMVVAFKGVTA